MNKRRTLRRLLVSLLLLVALLGQGTWALAGTTGSLSGQVIDDKGAPVAGAAVKVTSASQSASQTADASGRFSFLSLAPDTYVVSVAKEGYTPAAVPGITVFADQSQTLTVTIQKGLRQIAQVTSRSGGNLLKPGTTSDVYSVNETSAAAQQAAAGGYNLNSAYSAIYNQPGVQGAIGNYGFGQVFFIRGSAYSQVGYEFDGVPVNRAFDNYNANSLSSTGQQELQVYTGGSPAGSASATLGGFLNQVIKTGTFPGSAYANFGIGAPQFYHSAKVEVGGASPDRNFSYYVALSGYNQNYPFQTSTDGSGFANDGNNVAAAFGGIMTGGPGFNDGGGTNGRGVWSTCNANGSAPASSTPLYDTIFNPSIAKTIPTCYYYFPTTTGLNQAAPYFIADRENVINLHFGIPHRNDSGKDDVQVLFDNFSVPQYYQNDVSAVGGANAIDAGLAPLAAGLYGSPGGFSGPNANICAVNAALTLNALDPAAGVPCSTAAGSNPFVYAQAYIFGPGTQFGELAQNAHVIGYGYPFSPGGSYQPLPQNVEDSINNTGSIVKLQYQKNIGSSAFVRLFGYTFYSNWLQSSPYGTEMIANNLENVPANIVTSNDYELSAHTRGLQLQAADQVNDQNLVQLTANYTTSSVVRWNNYTSYQASGPETGALNLDQPTNWATFKNGVAQCYDFQNGQPDSCFSAGGQGFNGTQGTYGSPLGGWYKNVGSATSPKYEFVAYTSSNPCAQPNGNAALAGSPACAAGAATIVTVPADMGLRNAVTPQFWSTSLTDEFRPSDRWDINAGIRFEQYGYDLENTDTASNQFWFSAAAGTYCYDPGTGLAILTPITPSQPTQSPQLDPNQLAGQKPGVCYARTSKGAPTLTPLRGPSGQIALHPNGAGGNLLFSPVSPNQFILDAWSPRIGATYTVDPDTVLRGSFGQYTQPTQTAFEQYNGPSGPFLSNFLFTHFWNLGFHNPGHDNPLQTSENYDFSIEHHFKGTDWTIKASPYYRFTNNELVTVSLGGNFASGINAATQKSNGLEVAIQKGDPTRDGWSGQLAYTYSAAVQRFYTLSNGSNAIVNINNYIGAFNALTKAGGGAPCYNPGAPNASNGASAPVGNPALCTQAAAAKNGYVINPYYNDALQGQNDPNGWYNAYVNQPPNTPGAGTAAITSPNQFTGFINWKHGRLAITANPILQQGTTFGSPFDNIGYDPRFCPLNQAGNPASHLPGIPGTDTPGNANYQACGASAYTASGLMIAPNPVTGHFTGVGEYRNPWQFNLGFQVSYELNARVKATAVLANVFNSCFGGDTAPGTTFPPNNYVCGYTANPNYISDYYYGSSPYQAANGSAGFPGWMNQPYATVLGGLPFQAYFNLQIKL